MIYCKKSIYSCSKCENRNKNKNTYAKENIIINEPNFCKSNLINLDMKKEFSYLENRGILEENIDE